MPTNNLVQRSYIAGHFLCAWSSTSISSSAGATWTSIGSTQNGWRLRPTIHTNPVNDDAFGDGRADVIQAGADFMLEGITVQAKLVQASGVIWNSVGGEGYSLNNVGLRGSDIYGSICLTPIAGTPAANLIGAGNSYVIPLAGVVNDPEILLASKLREIPLSFDVLPDPNNANKFYLIEATPSGVPSTIPA